jgi:ribonuclease HII
MLRIENEIYENGYDYIACIDEVGRGCLAGSVVACAIIMPKGLLIDGVNDSKKLSAKKREKLFDEIVEKSIAIGIGEIDCKIVDEINIKNATKMAMLQAISNLKTKDGQVIVPDYLLIDAEKLNTTIPQSNIIQGDAKCHGIASASIIAKVTRDRMMDELDKVYPEYNFIKNKGYGTKAHTDAILKYGTISIHRHSFLKKILNKHEQLGMF